MTVKIVKNDRGNPPGKLADAELHFTEGPLAGLKLIGFSVGAPQRRGTERDVPGAAVQRQWRAPELRAAVPSPTRRRRTASATQSSRPTPKPRPLRRRRSRQEAERLGAPPLLHRPRGSNHSAMTTSGASPRRVLHSTDAPNS